MNAILIAVAITAVAVVVWLAKRGSLTSSGPYRVAVWESNGTTSEMMFDSLRDARSYADDAASEEDEPIARVFDAAGREIYKGRHWVLNAMFR